MKLLKIIFALLILFACIFCLISYLKPIPYSNSCGEDNLYRYRMGIYQIHTNIIKEKELKKLGGLLCFAGIQHIRCPYEIALQRDKMLAQAIDSTNSQSSHECFLFVYKRKHSTPCLGCKKL